MPRKKISVPEGSPRAEDPSSVSELNGAMAVEGPSRGINKCFTQYPDIGNVQEEDEGEEEYQSKEGQTFIMLNSLSQQFDRAESRFEKFLQCHESLSSRVATIERGFSSMEKKLEFLVTDNRSKKKNTTEGVFEHSQEGDPIQDARYQIPPRRNSIPLPRSESGSKFPLSRNPKFKISSFTGIEDVIIWIQRLNHHFETNAVEENLKVPIAIYYLDGKAMTWWNWMTKRGQHQLEWEGFCAAIKRRFGPKTLCLISCNL